MEEAIIVIINSFLVGFWVFPIVSAFPELCEALKKCPGTQVRPMILAWILLPWCWAGDGASRGTHRESWAPVPT